MKFARIIGKIDPKLIEKAQALLSAVFLELGTRYSNEHVGTGIGGDPLIFTLMEPVDHIATLNIPTAATDGKRFYWNPKFVLKHKKLGIRMICAHEAWHALYMHPQRRGSRLPKLWNIAVDYIVNGTVMEDLSKRKLNAAAEFTTHLGRYMTLPQYAQLIQNPFGKIEGFEDLNPNADSETSDVKLPGPTEDRELTPKELKELERREKVIKFFYADPDLPEDMRRPEKIYDYLYGLLPKCPKCGRVGVYKRPQKGQDGSGQGESQGSEQQEQQKEQQEQQGAKGQKESDQHNHGGDKPCEHGCPGHDHSSNSSPHSHGKGCDECGDGIDVFGLGGTLDDHIDTEESEEGLAKRVADAMEATRRMAGHVPASLEEELGKLLAPKVSWKDIIRARLMKARQGNGRNDWCRFKVRPMFTGLLVPKKKNYFAHFGCLLDTSGSMSKDDMAFGLSQLTSLDERSEGTIVPADAAIYWDKATKIKRANAEEISKVKIVGRGGTMFASFFDDYMKQIGHCDFLVVVTDGFLMDQEIAAMKNPGVDVIWLITSTSSFTPPFGRAFYLRG